MWNGKFIVSEKALIKRIKSTWYHFKICEVCDGLIEQEEPVCPVCKGYRFDEDREHIINRSLALYKKYRDFFIDKDLEQSECSDLDSHSEI
jgi:adenylate kinase family enzyme